jgi:hypothetical protein
MTFDLHGEARCPMEILTQSSEGMFCDAQDGPKRDELTGSWRTWRNEGLHNLCSSPNMINDDQIKEDEMGGVCSTHGRDKAYILV